MTEDVKMCLDDTREQMERSIEHFEVEMAKLRAGKASPGMLDGLMVDYYGTQTPIKQVANVNNQDAKTLVIQPWEKKMLDAIEKAIIAANLGVTPQNNGELIRLVMPPLTEERRKQLVKKLGELAEGTKVGIRNARKSANDFLRDLVKDGLPEDAGKAAEIKVQDLTNEFSELVEKYSKAKEEEIMTV